MENLYNYPEYYEIVFGGRDLDRECSFIKLVFQKFSKIKIFSILDIACGTGPHIRKLIDVGFNVAGLDISKGMLSILNTSLQNNPNFLGSYENDMANFNLNKKFDACICMVNSLEILNENNQFISHFESVAKCLNKGGLYFIELDNPRFILSNPLIGDKPKEYKKTIKREGINIELTYRKIGFDITESLELNELILKIKDGNKVIEVKDDSPVRRLTLAEIDLFLKINKQFELVNVFGGFNWNMSINNKNSEKMILILRRL